MNKMSFFRKFASKKNSKGVIGESSDNDLNTLRTAKVQSCEWPHNAFLEGGGIHQEFAQFVANVGLTDFIAAECDQYHLLTNSFVQNFHFLSRNNPPEVQFNFYAETRQIPLTDFCDICLIPSDGEIREPRPAEIEDFYRTMSVGDERGVSSVTAIMCIILLYSMRSVYLLERRLVHLVPPISLSYVVHYTVTTT